MSHKKVRQYNYVKSLVNMLSTGASIIIPPLSLHVYFFATKEANFMTGPEEYRSEHILFIQFLTPFLSTFRLKTMKIKYFLVF